MLIIIISLWEKFDKQSKKSVKKMTNESAK